MWKDTHGSHGRPMMQSWAVKEKRILLAYDFNTEVTEPHGVVKVRSSTPSQIWLFPKS